MLIAKLLEKEIDGFLLNSQTYQWFLKGLRKEGDIETVKGMIEYMMKTRVTSANNEYVSGISVKHHDDYMFFKDYIKNNRMRLELCYAARTLKEGSEIVLTGGLLADEEVFYAFLFCRNTWCVSCHRCYV